MAKPIKRRHLPAGQKYAQVKEILRQAVISGEYTPGEVLPGERSIAAAYGISYMTARRAIEALVSEGLFERQNKKTVVHEDAFSLASSIRVNVLYRRLDAFVEPLVNEVERMARDLNWVTQLIVMRDPNDRMATAAIQSGNPTLLLLADNFLLEGSIGRALLNSEGRAILVGNRVDNDAITSIKAVDRHVMRLGLSHLLDLGHRDILFVHTDILHRGLQDYLAEFRESEFHRDLQLKERRPLCVKVNEFEARPHATRRALRFYFTHQRVHPTAIICVNDEIAMGTLQELRALGLSVPKDISVLSFGNTVLTEYSTPAVSVIDLNFEQHIKIAFEVLAKRFSDGLNSPGQYFVEPTLLVRESTAAVA